MSGGWGVNWVKESYFLRVINKILLHNTVEVAHLRQP